ncbi:MAG: SDR family NAD(P)-dependent oxidoreductase [Myxococcales bacterium]|nr:SDR family NAD(P)-dependent oxidoreductase [Myxococcales bacterium]
MGRLSGVSLLALLRRNGPSGFGFASTAEEVTAGVDLRGRVALVTGSTSGLGRESARALALRGARVLMLARDEARARAAIATLRAALGDGPTLTPIACDLGEPASVRACLERLLRLELPIDIVLGNAGIMALPRAVTRHGLELQFLTNHVGHFMLVTGLLGRLTARARVVMVSSSAHAQTPPGGVQLDNLDGGRDYHRWRFYGQSKLANLLFARELATRLRPGQTANAVHPGVINTRLSRHMPIGTGLALALAGPIGLKSVAQGAATQCYVAAHPDAAGVTGEYWYDCNVQESSALGRDRQLAAELWARTEALVAGL